jgi:hypothetical protein
LNENEQISEQVFEFVKRSYIYNLTKSLLTVFTKSYIGTYVSLDIAVFFFANIIYAILCSTRKIEFSQDSLTAIRYTNG